MARIHALFINSIFHKLSFYLNILNIERILLKSYNSFKFMQEMIVLKANGKRLFKATLRVFVNLNGGSSTKRFHVNFRAFSFVRLWKLKIKAM